MEKVILYLTIILISLIATTAQQESPNIFWSMNKGNSTTILPDIGNPTVFYLPITPNEKAEGVQETDALRLNNSEIQVAGRHPNRNNLLARNCFVEPSLCEGLSYGMWLNMEQTATSFCFFTSTEFCDELHSPGVAVGIFNDQFYVTVKLTNGVFYRASFDPNLLSPDSWHHFGFVWNINSGIKIFINGSEPLTYVEVPYRASNKPATTNASSIIFGKRQLGPFRVTSALLDEVKLWYRPISDEDFRSSIAFESQSYDITTDTGITGSSTKETVTTTTASTETVTTSTPSIVQPTIATTKDTSTITPTSTITEPISITTSTETKSSSVLQSTSIPRHEDFPDVYWSMDRGNFSVILPDIGNSTIFYLPIIAQERASSEGVQESDALSLNMSEIEVARGNPNQFNLFIENCFVDSYMCQEGLTYGMWLKLEQNTTIFCFFSSSTTCDENSPGVAIGLADKAIYATVSTAYGNGTSYRGSVDASLLSPGLWHHFGFVWNVKNGIKIYINGSNSPHYAKTCRSNSPEAIYKQKITFGKNMADVRVLLDEVKLWYRPISDKAFRSSILFGSQTKVTTSLVNTGDGQGIEGTTTELSPTSSTGLWRWLVIGFCILILLVILIMIILLYKRKDKKRRRRRGQFFHIEMSSVMTGNTQSNYSSFPASSVEY